MIEAQYGITTFQAQRNERYVSGREAMLVELGKYGLGERDLVANINFFSKVIVDDAGALALHAGSLRSRATSVDLRFEMNTHRGAACRAAPAGPRLALCAARSDAAAGLAQRAAGRRRSLPQSLPGKRARLSQHRSATVAA